MSETKTDVASSPVSTLYSLDPICFDVVKANEHLDSITACSDCEDVIDNRNPSRRWRQTRAARKPEGNRPDRRARVVIATDTEGDDFTVVARKKKVAFIVIDASQNTTGLLNTLSEHFSQGRFENGKLRVFPKTILEHRKLQSSLAIKKMRSHTFEMADNKQLKAVIRGLPTD
ncbi:hypothetical protein TNCV_848672 [Trichonephila clavipes]|nr:hypothetical protein TNCV_848672 [Trichonephila clavipes]